MYYEHICIHVCIMHMRICVMRIYIEAENTRIVHTGYTYVYIYVYIYIYIYLEHICIHVYVESRA